MTIKKVFLSLAKTSVNLIIPNSLFGTLSKYLKFDYFEIIFFFYFIINGSFFIDRYTNFFTNQILNINISRNFFLLFP